MITKLNNFKARYISVKRIMQKLFFNNFRQKIKLKKPKNIGYS